jgi:hypothetical protein
VTKATFRVGEAEAALELAKTQAEDADDDGGDRVREATKALQRSRGDLQILQNPFNLVATAQAAVVAGEAQVSNF